MLVGLYYCDAVGFETVMYTSCQQMGILKKDTSQCS